MPSQPAPVPPDDPSRKLTVARPDRDQSLPHIGLVGDTYTILVTGEDTAGKYTLIDMHVPPGGGPPPLDAAARSAFIAKSKALTPEYKTELLPPPGAKDQFNQSTIAEFRASHGRVGDNFDGAPLLLLHTVGARSGQRRINPVMYLPDGDRYLVFASKAGSDRRVRTGSMTIKRGVPPPRSFGAHRDGERTAGVGEHD